MLLRMRGGGTGHLYSQQPILSLTLIKACKGVRRREPARWTARPGRDDAVAPGLAYSIKNSWLSGELFHFSTAAMVFATCLSGFIAVYS